MKVMLIVALLMIPVFFFVSRTMNWEFYYQEAVQKEATKIVDKRICDLVKLEYLKHPSLCLGEVEEGVLPPID